MILRQVVAGELPVAVFEPLVRFRRRHLTGAVHAIENKTCFRVPAGGTEEPRGGDIVIPWHPLTIAIHETKAVLRLGLTLVRGPAVPCRRLVVLAFMFTPQAAVELLFSAYASRM